VSRSLPRLSLRSDSGVPVVAAGLGVFLVGGVLAALFAARLLPASDYTIFAAYSSLIGLLVLGPCGSLEQESALRVSRAQGPADHVLRAMLLRAGAVFVVVTAVILSPGGWQERLLGTSAGFVTGCVLLGCPLVFAVAIARGYLTAHGTLRPVGAATAIIGVATLLAPVLLHAGGADWLSSFLAGAILAWLPALLVVYVYVPAAKARPTVSDEVEEAVGHHVTAWLLAGNLLMLAALLAVPIVLRWHVADLGAHRVAAAQLLVSISRLASTVVLGFLPLMVARLSAPGRRPGLATPWFALATALGVGSVVVLAVIGNPLVSWLQGTASHLSLRENLLSTLPVAALCPAVVAMALAISRQRWGLIVIAWSAALVVLTFAGAVDPGGELAPVLALIALGCLLPLVVLLAGLGRRQRHRRPGP
jgi:hypothetical protein